MFRGNDLALFPGSSQEGPFGQEIGSSQQASRTLVKGQDGLVGKELLLDAGDFQVMLDVSGHVLVLEPFEMALANDAGGQGP